MNATELSDADALQAMTSFIKRIATGPRMSKDLSVAEARLGTELILANRVDPVQAAVFLVALRMKRETEDENRGVLEALRAATGAAVADVDDLVDIADPYDGVNRHLPMAPFLPAVLAACGIPAVSHGCASMGPKYGISHRAVLAAASAPVACTPAEAAARIADPRVGWAYVDQEASCPGLHRLRDLRTQIVKRPCLATLEKLAGPVRAAGCNHLVVGYVHRGYEELLAAMARHAGYSSALIVRGVEGGVMPSLSGSSLATAFRDFAEPGLVELRPDELGIEAEERAIPVPDDAMRRAEVDGRETREVDVPAAAAAAAKLGLAALQGKPGLARDSLVFGGATVLWLRGRHSSFAAAARDVVKALDTRQALARFLA